MGPLQDTKTSHDQLGTPKYIYECTKAGRLNPNLIMW